MKHLYIITKWLESRKSRIKDTLLNTYHLNIDYKISKEKPNSKISKSNKEIILLTPDCFKRLCLLSKTKKGEEVRTYFIELEKLINNYKNYIIDGLKSTVKVLENNQKPISNNIKSTEHSKHIKSYHFVSKCMILYDFVCTFLVVKNTKIWYFYTTKNFYIINISLLYKKPLTKYIILYQNDIFC